MINTSFYRGYFELNENKEPGENGRRLYRTIKPEWQYVGAAFTKDYMMIDIDNFEDCDLFMQLVDKYKWQTHIVATDGGLHAIFKKPQEQLPSKKGAELLCGIIADIKQGRQAGTNSDYECIMKRGKYREVLQQCDDPQVLPWQLMPLSQDLHLKDVGEGSGRHGVHHKMIKVACWYTKDASEIIDLVCWVNENIFDAPRKSVNWTVKQVQKWIDETLSEDNSIDELLQQYDINLHKLNLFIKTNFEKKVK